MQKYLPLLLLLFGLNVYGQSVSDTIVRKDSIDYYELSLEQLLNLKAHGVPSELEELINSLISVASKKPLSSRESPGIITLVTEEEIKNSGARDLIDVLRMVPGFDFGVDVEGVVGIGTRGNWAHEGKVLLLLDGQEMNETLFATTQWGNHFPIGLIKRIEIIRGPGSAIYGGFAEYGVINIITLDGKDLNGVLASGTYGQMGNTTGRINGELAAGIANDDLNISLSGFKGSAIRSDREFTDIYGSSYAMPGSSDILPTLVNLGASYKGFSFRTIADIYRYTARTAFDTIHPEPFTENFNSFHSELKYTYSPNKKFSLVPRINFKTEEPWKTIGNTGIENYHKVSNKYTGNITASYNFTRKINLILGGEAFLNSATDKIDSSFFSDGTKKVSYMNYSIFSQALLKHRIANLILGARYDMHSAYGSAFVPRIGITKKLDRFHFKLLYSNSFRAPSIENINLQDSTGIRPEKTSVIELEGGYQISRNSILTLNLYDIDTRKPIVYYVTPSLDDAYRNFGRSGTRGAELEFRIKEKWGYFNINYSFYSTQGQTKIFDYRVPGVEDVVLAFPAHKANIYASVKLTKNIRLNPSILWNSSRYAYTSVDSLGNTLIEKLDPSFQANLFLRFTDIGFKGFDVSVGVYDLFDQGMMFIQPYNGYHAPLPGPSREFLVRLSYHFTKKKRKDA